MAKEAAEAYKREKYGDTTDTTESKECFKFVPNITERQPSLLELHLQKLEQDKEEKEKKDKKESRKRKRDKDKKDKDRKDKHRKHKKHKSDKKEKRDKHKSSKSDKDKNEKPAYWDRDRDLIISQNDPKRRAALLQSAAGLSSRFEDRGYL